ncbi:MAG: hypothetical protein AAF570_08930 [Bacteroidota bacterium]
MPEDQLQAPLATFSEGEMHNNDVTMQAMANAWPRNMLGRRVNEEEAYDLISVLVIRRGLPFNASNVNVISIRAFQGGEIHDNNEGQSDGAFHRANTFNDTTYILSVQNGEKKVTESRSTVDPGDIRRRANDPRNARKRANVFRMEADQQWDYRANSRGHTAKYDRPMYGLADRTQVTRGRFWQDNPDLLAGALRRAHSGARVISDRTGRLFGDVNRRRRANRVSAIHSGGGGSATGDQVGGDSTGCSVVHGAWFAHFNENLRRAAGTRSSAGASQSVQFTYSLLDLRLFNPNELDAIIRRTNLGEPVDE